MGNLKRMERENAALVRKNKRANKRMVREDKKKITKKNVKIILSKYFRRFTS